MGKSWKDKNRREKWDRFGSKETNKKFKKKWQLPDSIKIPNWDQYEDKDNAEGY